MIRRLLRGKAAKKKLERELNSLPLREKFRHHGVDIGLYSYGCFDFRRVPPGTTVGRYCSIANTAQIFLRNHGIEFLGLTAYLYNPTLGTVDRDMVETYRLDISDDVWLGHNSIILPSTKSIGRGAIVAAGAVVTKPVPAYAIVAGNPARVIRMRFEPHIIEAIEKTRWWEKTPEELKEMIAQTPDLVFRPREYFAADA
ncbi:MAG: CatB-related O-acetyltransferase [Sphingobium sp.]|nr:CatB-related O-acetyltransferase [Sphingobium sp.]